MIGGPLHDDVFVDFGRDLVLLGPANVRQRWDTKHVHRVDGPIQASRVQAQNASSTLLLFKMSLILLAKTCGRRGYIRWTGCRDSGFRFISRKLNINPTFQDALLLLVGSCSARTSSCCCAATEHYHSWSIWTLSSSLPITYVLRKSPDKSS